MKIDYVTIEKNDNRLCDYETKWDFEKIIKDKLDNWLYDISPIDTWLKNNRLIDNLLNNNWSNDNWPNGNCPNC
jgi:hypothetical protein